LEEMIIPCLIFNPSNFLVRSKKWIVYWF
jgi:hypothetical protein